MNALRSNGGPKETIEAGMKPLRPNGALEAKWDHGGQDETVKVKRGRDKAKRGLGDLNEAIEAGMRPLRPNGALEAKRGHVGWDEGWDEAIKAKRVLGSIFFFFNKCKFHSQSLLPHPPLQVRIEHSQNCVEEYIIKIKFYYLLLLIMIMYNNRTYLMTNLWAMSW